MKLIYTISILFLLIASACTKNSYLDSEIDKTYIEFQNKELYEIVPYFVDGDYLIGIPFQVFGKNLTENTKVECTVTNTNLKVGYNLFYTSTIELNKSNIIDTLYISIKPKKNIYALKDYFVSLELTSDDSKIIIPQNLNKITLTFQQESFATFYTGEYTCYESNTGSTYNVIFTRQDSSSILNTNFWDFPSIGETVVYSLNQNDNTIEIPQTTFVDKNNNVYTVYGNGTLYSNGDMEVEYFMEEDGSIYQHGTHTFTKD